MEEGQYVTVVYRLEPYPKNTHTRKRRKNQCTVNSYYFTYPRFLNRHEAWNHYYNLYDGVVAVTFESYSKRLARIRENRRKRKLLKNENRLVQTVGS